VAGWIDRALPSELAVQWLVAGLVGLGTGIGGVVFIYAIAQVSRILYGVVPEALSWPWALWLIAAPALGGLIAGPIIAFFAREAKGHGVPEVMQAIALRGGRIRPQVVIGKVLASAACIGSGGSAGREGPIVQVGAALGSTAAQFLRFSETRTRNLVACGAAAGIAATFNAPIAGVMFAIEIILGELNPGDLGSLVISAVTASALARSVLGDRPSFDVPAYTLGAPVELILYVVLGALCALVGVGFIRVLYAAEDLFDGWHFPGWLKPAVGGALLGILAVAYLYALGTLPSSTPVIPEIYGSGFPTIEAALQQALPLALLLVLALLKPIATSLTLGSGNSGGVFAPALFTGSMLGGAFGSAAAFLLPGVVSGSGGYATVGMAAVFAAAARAPLSAILIVFEMTDDYRLILPLMAAVVAATALAGYLHRESIYTLKLVRRGIHLARGRDIDILDSVRVEEVMRQKPVTVPVDFPCSEIGDLFLRSNAHAFLVLDRQGLLAGMVSLEDYRRASEGKVVLEDLTVGDIATRGLVLAYPRESMRTVLRKMAPRDLSRLPVVDPDDPRRLLGVVRRNDIVRAYELGTVRREARPGGVPLGPGATMHELTLEKPDAAVGRRLDELAFPTGCRVVSVIRGEQTVLASGTTELRAGDRVRLIVVGGEPAEVERLLREGPPPAEEA
jgi:CIC family chloride channel protein